MCAVKYAARFLDGGEVAERTCNKSDIIVDSLWHADDGEPVAPAGGFLENGVAAALGTISPNGKQDVDAPLNQILNRSGNVHRSAGRAQNRTAPLMDFMHILGRDCDRLNSTFRIQPAVAAAEANYLGGTIAKVQFQEE
jgi:hypothetical protein